MREKLTAGEIPFRKAYLASLVDRIEVDDREARIVGRKESAGTGSPGDQSRPDRC
jgi:site-specific DNA recombinase